MDSPLKSFPTRIEIPVAWGEMDSFGHVNNIIYFRYFETARIHYMKTIGLLDEFKQSAIGPILSHTACRFRKPLHFPQTVTVGARINTLTPERFTHEYQIYSPHYDALAAEGEGTIVAFDYQKNQKAQFPPTVLKAIEKLEGRTF